MRGWKNWLDEADFFVKNKLYMLFLSLTAACGYGFLVTHQTVGIDDTPYAYYFEEGLNAIVGRWFLYLANKIFHISNFSPFLTDFVGVLLLMAAAIIWCRLLRAICKDRVPMCGYLFFSCIFISCPLIGEVYTYYLHNGISVGYLCTGISLCCFRQFLVLAGYVDDVDDREHTGPQARGKRGGLVAAWCGTTVFLWCALGCYESFMIVWLLGVFLVLLTGKYMGVQRKVFLPLVWTATVAAAAVLLRSVMISAVIAAFGLGGMRDEAVQRSITEMLSWMFEEGAFAEFAMAVKRIYVMYGVFAYAYYPVKVFVCAAAVMTVFSIWRGIRQRSLWIPTLTAGGFLVCFLLAVVEGKATYYRTAQFLPIVCGYGAFLAVYAAQGLKAMCSTTAENLREMEGREVVEERSWKGKAKVWLSSAANGLVIFILCAVTWNQCFDLNHWFYVDWLKYESALDTMNHVALELERDFDITKPVVFTGRYDVPREIIADAYVAYGTDTFYKLKRWTDPVDEHLLEKFYRNYGVWVAQTPELSVIEWGRYAFGDDSELVRFFAMHGHKLVPYTQSENYEAAEIYSLDLPGFPREGSIVDMGEYIIVHF